jgi:membrane protein YqaA with SNARE-associated domain
VLFVTKLAAWAAKILLPLGGQGLFVAAVLDSSFIPLPEGVDLWLISLSLLRPERMPYYILLSTLGSVLGCSILYFLVRWGEEKFIENNPKYAALPRVRRWVEKYEFMALLVGAILPPPTPFKLVVIAAGLVKGRFEKFVIALILGRTIRYAGEAILAVRYGKRAWGWLLHAGPYVFLAAILVGVIVYFLKRSSVNPAEA